MILPSSSTYKLAEVCPSHGWAMSRTVYAQPGRIAQVSTTGLGFAGTSHHHVFQDRSIQYIIQNLLSSKKLNLRLNTGHQGQPVLISRVDLGSFYVSVFLFMGETYVPIILRYFCKKADNSEMFLFTSPFPLENQLVSSRCYRYHKRQKLIIIVNNRSLLLRYVSQ